MEINILAFLRSPGTTTQKEYGFPVSNWPLFPLDVEMN